MRAIVELTGLSDCKIAIDSRTIFAISEMFEEKGIPEHRVIFTDKNCFRVIDTYDAIINKIKEINKLEDLGL